MKRAPVPVAPVTVSVVTSRAPTPPDDALLAALDASPNALHDMRSKAATAYNQARARAAAANTGDWMELDEYWQAALSSVTAAVHAQQAEHTVNTVGHKAARIAEARTLLAMAGYFDAYQPSPTNPPSVSNWPMFAEIEPRERAFIEVEKAA